MIIMKYLEVLDIRELGFISSCTMNDVKKLDLVNLKNNFDSHFKNPVNKKIKLYT